MVDAAGNATGAAGDGTTVYGYDALSRQTSVNYSDATPDVAFTYDPNGNRLTMADGAGTESYTYDDLNRVTDITRGTESSSYEYNATSQVTSRTYPDGSTTSYTYDAEGNMASATSAGATTTYAYDAAGNLTRTELPASNGHVETRSYDRAGRVTEVTTAKAGAVPLATATYSYDSVGNPLEVVAGEGRTTYSYDALDRLVEVCLPPTGCADAVAPSYIRYTYDNVGNRLTEERPLELPTTYTYNASDQLTSSTDASGTTTYSHDANGNLTEAGSKSYGYDLANRTTSATVGGLTTTYDYDGDGTRLRTSTGPDPTDKTDYTWDKNFPLPMLVRESEGSGALLRRYVYGNDLISMTTGGAESFFHYDALGSVTNVTRADGVLQWSYSYEPFGTSRSATKIDPGAPENPMRFTGAYLDPTGFYHLRARQYDAVLGRFTATDPVPQVESDPYHSAYSYVWNRPTVMTDASGLTPDEITGITQGGSWWWWLFHRDNKHLVIRDRRPGLHWNNHRNRFEYDGRPSRHPGWHTHVDDGPPKPVPAPLGGLGGEIFIIPPLPGEALCVLLGFGGDNPCESRPIA